MLRVTLALAGALAGCSKAKEPPPGNGSARMRLYTDAELAHVRADLTAKLDATAKRRCIRPVLSGDPLPGPATRDMIAICEPTGPLAACVKQLHEVTDVKAQVANRAPALLAIDRRCGAALEAAMRAAIAHEDACSPYQIGEKALPMLADVLRIAHLMGLRAELAADRGELAGGLQLLLATTRFAQDLGRGHQGLLGLMIGSAAAESAIDHARALLEQRPDAATLATVAAQLDALLASEPSFTDGLAAEGEQFALYFGAPGLEPDGWIPPGGWPAGMSKPAVGSDPRFDPRDLAAVSVAVGTEIETSTVAGCPQGAPLLTCYQGLASLAGSPTSTDDLDLAAMATRLANGSATDPATLRATLIRQLTDIAIPAYASYVAKRARTTALLASLRLHVELLRVAHCPTRAELDAPPFATLITPPILGASLTVTAQGPALEVGLPAFVTANGRGPWRVACR